MSEANNGSYHYGEKFNRPLSYWEEKFANEINDAVLDYNNEYNAKLRVSGITICKYNKTLKYCTVSAGRGRGIGRDRAHKMENFFLSKNYDVYFEPRGNMLRVWANNTYNG